MAADIFLDLAFYFQVAYWGACLKNCTFDLEMPRLRNLTAKAKKKLFFLDNTVRYGTYHMSQYHTDHGSCVSANMK
jgi:hypothetical protein